MLFSKHFLHLTVQWSIIHISAPTQNIGKIWPDMGQRKYRLSRQIWRFSKNLPILSPSTFWINSNATSQAWYRQIF